jgi:mannose-6-phosphate isomerase-like protein (cupin superfamily)
MDVFDAQELIAAQAGPGHTYRDLLRSERLSLGIAYWPADAVDTQQPHPEDEVYYVVSGRGRITVAGETAELGEGSIVFVGAGVEHRFHDVTDDLATIVFWSPPRGPR